MSSFLFIISFLLHIILLAIVYYLFQQIQLLKKNNTNEVTELFESYLREIRSENRRLESEIESKVSHTDQEKVTQQFESNIINEEVTNKVDLDKPILKTDTIHDKFETSLEAKILQLYHQGMEVTEIAQMLNCGKTETSLIINLSKKRNQKS